MNGKLELSSSVPKDLYYRPFKTASGDQTGPSSVPAVVIIGKLAV